MEEIKISDVQVEQQQTLLKLSASSTKTYEQCPKKYFYTYIDKLPKKSWGHLTLGKFCHAVLEQFHKEWKIDKNLDLVQLMVKCFATQRNEPDYKTMSTDQLEDAKAMLQEYLFSMEKGGMPNVLSVEEPFKIVVDKYILRGFIDRIDVDRDGLFHIVDYKTTKNEKYLDDFQLLVYGIALREKYPEVERYRGSYVLLKKNSKLVTQEFNIQDILKCQSKIIDFGNRIEQEQKWEKRPSQLCNWCDFYDPCQGAWI